MNSSPSRSEKASAAVPKLSPLDEFHGVLDRIERRIVAARESYRDALIAAAKPPEPTPPTPRGFGRFLLRGRSADNPPSTPTRKEPPSPSPSPLRPSPPSTGPIADFIPFSSSFTDDMVEDLRRIAELCIIGENFATRLQKKKDTAAERAKQRWAAARDALLEDISESEPAYEEDSPEMENLQLFDLFFERNALVTIVDLLHGECFRFDKFPRISEVTDASTTTETATSEEPEETVTPEFHLEAETLLPPLAVATQALQSVSILIQNVSRATSLYVILSNNCINKLIDVPLHLYAIAERRRLIATKESKALPAVFSSPQVTEVATHFVTFLKSLALRMNAETLQFFIKYNEPQSSIGADAPATSAGDVDPNVEFPLYLRALEFCAAHQDSFVRTTALNICLNTLRMTTIASEMDDSPSKIVTEGHADDIQSSPDGVLHNAKPLPYHERLVIAQYACIPSRVEHLISPIFTKLAERWSALDEHIRQMDTNKHMGFAEATDDVGVRNERVAVAKEKVRRDRMLRRLKELVADLQDELLLLDDVFKVGLTVLNEQLVETMLATFVYPMLLQPLVIYCQRLTALVDEDRFSFSEHPFGRISADLSDVEKSLIEVAGPAKAALFTLASVFQFLSNRPLLRLLFTVLFHPLSPDSTSAPTVRSKLEVASVDSKGRKSIRLDLFHLMDDDTPNDRTTYNFGTDPANRRRARSSSIYPVGGDNEACIFVLAPALAEVLEFRGEDLSLIARTRPNPYRRAILKCLTVPDDMSDIRELAICMFDTALMSFHGSFGSTILFGVDIKTFADDMPADERNLDSMYAHNEDDRGMGGSAPLESRHSLSPQRSGSVGTDLIGEVVSALCLCVIYANRVASDEWKLGYDNVAAHVLLLAVQYHPGGILAASKIMDLRHRQAAASLAEIPSGGLIPMGGSSLTLPGSPNINDSEYEDRMFENFLNLVFYDTLQLGGSPVVEEFLLLKTGILVDYKSRKDFAIPISCPCDPETPISRIGKFLSSLEFIPGLREFNLEMIEERRDGARAWVKLDALLNLLKYLSSNSGVTIRDVSLNGVMLRCNGVVSKVSRDPMDRSVYAIASSTLINSLYLEESSDEGQLSTQSVIDLDSHLCIPCVCEVAGPVAQFFTDAVSSSLQSEGVTWQSLYIVIIQSLESTHLVFAQVLPATGGSTGRIISVFPLERVTLERDIVIPEDGSPARRLCIYHKWFDQKPPPLFLFDEMPNFTDCGDFVEAKSFTSRLDVWMENEYSANQAFEILSNHVFLAKAQRGRRLLKFLDPQSDRNAL